MRLPERIEGDGVLLRRWLIDDAAALERAIEESAEHLRPWMPWMEGSPQSPEQRRAMLAEWEREWLDGGDVIFGVLVENQIAGSCGLHRRRGPGVLEIGYWIHAAFLRRGLATTVARLLTDAAFSVPGIARVEIHHDRANIASAGVPRRLGYEFVGEQPNAQPAAPAELGIDYVWRIERDQWSRGRGSPRNAPKPRPV
jgi:RimJ/RimL family protein N-acetyltransferase